MTNNPDYQNEFDITDKAGNKIFIEVEIFDIKFTFFSGDSMANWPEEWEIAGYDSKVFITYGDNDRLEITDKINKNGLLMTFAPEGKILKEMIPKWKEQKGNYE